MVRARAGLGGALLKEVDEARHEGLVDDRGHADQPARGAQAVGGLGVEVVDDLHVVRDEADRGEDDAAPALGRQLLEPRSFTSGSSHGWFGGPDREQ